MTLDHELQNYIADMRSSNEFLELKRIGDIVRKLVETKKDIVYPFIYLLRNLVTYSKNDVFSSVDNEVIMQRFQHIKTRQG